MIRFTIALFAVAFLVTPLRAEDKAKAAERDMKALQGNWTVTAAHRDGKKLTDAERAGDLLLTGLVIENDKVQLKFKADNAIDWYFELNPSVTPKIAKIGEQNDKKSYVLYAVEGDKLTIIYMPKEGEDRNKLPAKLETKPRPCAAFQTTWSK